MTAWREFDEEPERRKGNGAPCSGRYKTVRYEKLSDFRQQMAGAVGLGDIGVAARFARSLLVATQRVGCDGDNRNVFRAQDRA